jgi:plastocyanin
MLCRTCGNEMIASEYCSDCNEAVKWRCSVCSCPMNTKQTKFALFLLSCITIFPLSAANLSSYLPLAIAQTQQPDIKASNVYQNYAMILGKDIKNLVVVIPNEGHEDPNAPPKDLRVVNQPYLPYNAVVNVGTTVTWFNGDAGHHHSISLVDGNGGTVYDSGLFDNFNASKPITFNNTGTFAYSGPSYDKMVPNYKMNGTITVVDQPLTTPLNTTTTASSAGASNNTVDTITTLIVPANLLDKVVSDLQGRGFGIDNQYPFMSLRGGGSASGGDKQQVMLVLTSSGKNLNEVVSALSNVAPTMPYR